MGFKAKVTAILTLILQLLLFPTQNETKAFQRQLIPAIQKKNYKQVIELYRQYNKSYINNEDYYINYAWAYFNVGEDYKGVGILRRGLYYNQGSKKIKSLLFSISKDYYDDYTSFPFYLRVNTFYAFLFILCISIAIILLSAFYKKRKILLVLRGCLILVFLFYALYLFYPGISREGIILVKNGVKTFPSVNSENKIQIDPGIIVKIKYEIHDFYYITDKFGKSGWVEKKYIMKVFHD